MRTRHHERRDEELAAEVERRRAANEPVTLIGLSRALGRNVGSVWRSCVRLGIKTDRRIGNVPEVFMRCKADDCRALVLPGAEAEHLDWAHGIVASAAVVSRYFEQAKDVPDALDAGVIE